MRSIRNKLIRCDGELYISVSVSTAIEMQNKNYGIKQFGKRKSLYVKVEDAKEFMRIDGIETETFNFLRNLDLKMGMGLIK